MPAAPFAPSAAPPTLALIREVATAIATHLPPTPLVRLPASDGRVRVAKAEYLQPTGSFKVRGGLAAALAARADGQDRVVAASAGNHGSGLAWGARRAGIAVDVVVPRDCPPLKLAKMRDAGATVHVADEPGYDAAETQARALAADRGLPFVSPFDDTRVMAANGGTMLLELLDALDDATRPLRLIVPVGGGGLLAGLLAARDALGVPIHIVPVQSSASPAFVRSLADGRLHATWPPAPTLAEGLEGGAGATSVWMADRAGLRPHLVSEAEIDRAMRRLYAALDHTIEGSAAVAWAAVDPDGVDSLGPDPDDRMDVLLLTGGNAPPPAPRPGTAP